MKRFLLPFFVLVGILMVPTGVILAAPLDRIVDETVNNDIAIFGEDLILKTGSVVNGDVIVFGGDAEIQGTINGDLAVFGGDVAVANRVKGDIVLFGGDLEAADGASVRGDCVLLGGDFESNGGTDLGCTSSGRVNLDFPTDVLPDEFPSIETASQGFLGNIAAAIGSSFLAGVLAFVAASAVPQHMQQVERTIRAQPAASGAMGLLTAVAVPAIIVLLVPISAILLFVCVGILGFPIMLALGVGLFAGSVFGWLTMGQVVGQRLATALNWRKLSSPMTAALGAAVMTFGISFLGAISLGFFEGLLTMVVSFVGLGAVALTQFGRKPYPYLAQPAQRVVEADTMADNIHIMVDEDKVTAVLDTLPDEDDITLN